MARKEMVSESSISKAAQLKLNLNRIEDMAKKGVVLKAAAELIKAQCKEQREILSHWQLLTILKTANEALDDALLEVVFQLFDAGYPNTKVKTLLFNLFSERKLRGYRSLWKELKTLPKA